MNFNVYLNNIRRITALLVIAVMIILFSTWYVYADDELHISASCTPAEICVGDTFLLRLNISEMTVTTFTGYVKYDDSMIEYVSYSGNSSDDKNDSLLFDLNNISHTLSIGANETEPYFGFALIGISDVEYAAADGFLELVFKAKSPGTPYFFIGEDSDGMDGLAAETGFSPDIIIVDSETTGDEKGIIALEIDEEPDKTDYVSGDYFDSSGMVIKAIYSDGTSEIITDYSVFDKTLTEDDNEMVIKYRGITVSQPISVNAENESVDLELSETDDSKENDNETVIETIDSKVHENEAVNGKTYNPVVLLMAAAVLITVIVILTMVLIRKRKNNS